MDDVIRGFLVSIGFAADDTSRAKAERSVDAYEKAVRDAEKAIEDARWAVRRPRRRSPSSRGNST